MYEQENFTKSGEKKQNFLKLRAVCENESAKNCEACTMRGKWQCPKNHKQPPEVSAAIQNIAIGNIQNILNGS